MMETGEPFFFFFILTIVNSYYFIHLRRRKWQRQEAKIRKNGNGKGIGERDPVPRVVDSRMYKRTRPLVYDSLL